MASRLVVLDRRWAAKDNKIAVGPDLAHGSWFVRKAVLPPAV
jgi:hypothetical protein